MSKLGTRANRLGNLIQDEYGTEYGYCRKVVTVTEAAQVTYEIGRVIGDDNDTYQDTDAFVGIYIGSPAGEDSQVIAAATPTDVVVLYRGPAAVGKASLVYGTSVNNSTKLDAMYALIEAKGIQLIDQPEQF